MNPSNPFIKLIPQTNLDNPFLRTGTTPQPQLARPAPESKYSERVGEGYKNIGSRLTKNLTETGTQYLKEGEQGDVVGATGSLLRGGLRTVGAVAEGAFTPIVEIKPIKKALEFIGTKLGETKIGKKLGQKIEQNPEKAQDVFDVLNIVALGGGKTVEKPLTQLGKKALPKTVETSLTKLGGGFKSVGEKAYKIGVPMQEGTKILEQTYQASKPTLLERIGSLISGEKKTSLGKPITEAQTAARYRLIGTEWQLGVQAKRVGDNLWKKIVEPALENSTNKTDMKIFLQDIKKEIIANNPVGVRRNQLLKSWEAFSSPFKKVGKISDKRLQTYKEDWAKLIPEATYKNTNKPIGSTLKEIQNIAAKKAREILYSSLGNDGRIAFIDYGNLKSIAELGRKTVDQLRTKGITRQAWEFILDPAVVPVSTIMGQVLYRTGQGLEFIGKQGAKTIRDILGISLNK